MEMEYVHGSNYGGTNYYSVTVILTDEDENEINIEVSVCTSWSEDRDDEYIMEIIVQNSEDLPDGVSEEDIIEFVQQNFEQ